MSADIPLLNNENEERNKNKKDAQPVVNTTAFCPHCGAKVRVGVLLLSEQ